MVAGPSRNTSARPATSSFRLSMTNTATGVAIWTTQRRGVYAKRPFDSTSTATMGSRRRSVQSEANAPGSSM